MIEKAHIDLFNFLEELYQQHDKVKSDVVVIIKAQKVPHQTDLKQQHKQGLNKNRF